MAQREKHPKNRVFSQVNVKVFLFSFGESNNSPKMKRLQYPPENEILFLKGVVNYTEFHLKNGRKEISSFTLLRHQERHEQFLRVNKSHLVNPNCILKITQKGTCKELILNNGARVKVSRRRTEVLNQINFQK